MEQQKVLWIIFSVALFMLIVVGVGFIWFFPQDGGLAQAASAGGKGEGDSAEKSSEKEFDPIEWVKTSGEYPDLRPSEDEKEEAEEEGEDFVIVYGEDKETGISPSAEADKGKEGGKLPEYDESGEKDTGKDAAASGKTSGGESPTREPTVHRKESTKESKESTAAAKKEAPKKEITVREYWIQAGSYKSKNRAADVKTKLAERGVESRLTSREIDGTTYFRVRIGPYQEEAEAEKFLAWIKDVRGFESSYVSMVYAKRRLN